MRDIKAIIPKTVAVVDGDSRVVSVIDLLDLIEEIEEAAQERRGEKGDRGDKGEQGLPGKDGRDGRDGIDGKPGKDGKDGAPGKDGRDGVDGRPGRDGLNGLDGRAPEHEVDPAKPAVRFKNPDGTWGAWIIPPAGKNGRSGGGSSWSGSAEFEAKVREISGSVAGARSMFIQPDPPTVAAGTPYLWIETGLGAGGNDITFWVEDGT